MRTLQIMSFLIVFMIANLHFLSEATLASASQDKKQAQTPAKPVEQFGDSGRDGANKACDQASNRSDNQRSGLEWPQAILFVATVAFIMATTFSCLKIINDTKKEIQVTISEKTDRFLSTKYPEIQKNVSGMIEEYIRNDFSQSLEERYFAMEVVYVGIWDKISEAIGPAWRDQNVMKLTNLWNNLYVSQLALRGLLSGDQKEVFTGMGILRGKAEQGIVPTEDLWRLLCILKRQNRFSIENLRLAQKLGQVIGKTFHDC